MERDQSRSPGALAGAIADFIARAQSPVLIEPGEEPIALKDGQYAVEVRRGRVWIEAWDGGRSLSRRATELAETRAGRLEIVVERFGKRRGTLTLADRDRRPGAAAEQRGRRLAFCERFRRMVLRQFPGWELKELTTGADLEHSLSPAYARGLVRRGQSAWAVIGAPEGAHGDGVLSFGILWLDHLRRRRREPIQGLALFIPVCRHEVVAQRMRFLASDAARWRLFVYSACEGERLVDPADLGNLRTRLEPPRTSPLFGAHEVESELARIEGVEIIDLPGGGRSYRVRGLEFGRAVGGALLAGIDHKRKVRTGGAGKLAALAEELNRIRRAGAADPCHPYYRRQPESWLESQIRRRIDALDATLHREPVYGQVPAVEAGDRDVLDLLAADRSGRLAVIEVKAAADIHMPLQALDYWMRVRRHALRGEFRARGYFPGLPLTADPPRLLLVAPALEFHPALEAILRYLSPEVPVERIGLAHDWRREIRVVFRAAGAGLPGT